MSKSTSLSRKRASTRRTKYDNVLVRRVIVGVIMTAIVVVVASLICSFCFNSEKVVKAKLDEMAREYYEGYIYENTVYGSMSQREIEKKMDIYAKKGFSQVNLRQLLLYDGRKNSENAGFVKNYCDENRTSVKFYPEPPYDRKSYRMEYTYRCEW